MLQNIFHAVVEVPRWTNAKMEVRFHICFLYSFMTSVARSVLTLSVYVNYDVHLSMKAWNLGYLQFWGLGHFLCSHRYDRGNLAFKRFYSTLHSPPLWTSRRLFFCFCFCICICDVPGILSCSQLKSSRDDWLTCGRADYSVLKSKACWCHLKCLSPTVSSLAH